MYGVSQKPGTVAIYKKTEISIASFSDAYQVQCTFKINAHREKYNLLLKVFNEKVQGMSYCEWL